MRNTSDAGPSGDRPENVLNIAAILYESGAIQFRYWRYIRERARLLAILGAGWNRRGTNRVCGWGRSRESPLRG